MISVGFSASLNEKDIQLRAKYQEAIDSYKKAVSLYKEAKSDFFSAKTKYQQIKCVDGEPGTKCAQIKEEMLEKAKNYLLKITDAMIKYLEAMKNKASGMHKIGEEEKTKMVAELDTTINEIKTFQEKIKNAQDKESLTVVAQELKKKWKEIRVTAKKVTGQMLNAKIAYLISKAQEFSKKISEKITELKAAGKDTTNLEAWLNDFNSKIALAQQKHDQAAEKFAAMTTLAEVHALFKAGKGFIKEARQYLKEAHRDLVKIVQEFKKA